MTKMNIELDGKGIEKPVMEQIIASIPQDEFDALARAITSDLYLNRESDLWKRAKREVIDKVKAQVEKEFSIEHFRARVREIIEQRQAAFDEMIDQEVIEDAVRREIKTMIHNGMFKAVRNEVLAVMKDSLATVHNDIRTQLGPEMDRFMRDLFNRCESTIHGPVTH